MYHQEKKSYEQQLKFKEKQYLKKIEDLEMQLAETVERLEARE